MTKPLPPRFFTSPAGSGVSLNFRFRLYSSKPMPCNNPYNNDVGRLRIKKKEAVIPFRETLAYRMILLAGSVIVFLIALYITIGAFQTGITASSISSAIIAAGGAFAIFYNADHLRDARIPKQTLNRMKRR